MIGLKNDVKSMIENKESVCMKLADVNNAILAHQSNLDKKDELINQLQNDLIEINKLALDIKANYVTMADLNSLVEEIKTSFEMFINTTPRNNDDLKGLVQRLDALEKRVTALPDITLISKNATDEVPRSIPKLNLKKKN